MCTINRGLFHICLQKDKTHFLVLCWQEAWFTPRLIRSRTVFFSLANTKMWISYCCSNGSWKTFSENVSVILLNTDQFHVVPVRFLSAVIVWCVFRQDCNSVKQVSAPHLRLETELSLSISPVSNCSASCFTSIYSFKYDIKPPPHPRVIMRRMWPSVSR